MPSTINERISYLIDLLDLSKNTFAKKLGTSSGRISNITTGRNKPDSDILARIKTTFEVNGDWLLDGEGEIFKESKHLRFSGEQSLSSENPPQEKKTYNDKLKDLLREMKRSQRGLNIELPRTWGKDESEYDFQAKEKSIQKSPTTPSYTKDLHTNENIIFVPAKEQGKYILRYRDSLYLKELPTLTLPNFPVGLFRAFEVVDNSMLQLKGTGLHSGDIVISSYVEKPEEIKDSNLYVIVSDKEVYTRRCFNRLKANHMIICESDNKNYPPFLLAQDEIKEIWEIKLEISWKVSNKNTLEEELTELKTKLILLSQRLLNMEHSAGKTPD